MTKLCISVDIEGDLPGILERGGTRGVDEGLPRLLAVLREFHVKTDFFFLASIAKDRPDLVKQLADAGHGIGNHGLDHKALCAKPPALQRQNIDESTHILEEIRSARPTMFRAPNFSVNRTTHHILAEAGYTIDSSVLPGRYVTRFRVLRVYDHRGAPEEPYRISTGGGRSGGTELVEVPVTENPLQRGTPIGLGALNRFGTGPLIDFLRNTQLSAVLFLIHPWELIDLASAYPEAPAGYAAVCSADIGSLREFLREAQSTAEFSSIPEIASSSGGA